MSPNASPSRVTASGPSSTSRRVAPGKKSALTTMIEMSRTAGMRSEASSGRSRPAASPGRAITRQDRQDDRRQEERRQQDEPEASSFVIGLRRWSQLVPAR